MTEPSNEGLFIDSDWKEEARREKDRLADKEKKAKADAKGSPPPGKPGFADLLNVLVLQVVAALGGMVGPNGERTPPDLGGAGYFIDLIGALEEKTKGNLTTEEQKLMASVLNDLRIQYVHIANALAGIGPGAAGTSASQHP